MEVQKFGFYSCLPLLTGIKKTTDEFPQFIAQVRLLEFFDETIRAWIPCDEEAFMSIPLFHDPKNLKKPEPTLNHPQVSKVFNWDGTDFGYLNDTDFSDLKFQVRIENDDDPATIFNYKITWLGISNTPMRICCKCRRSLPETRDFFHYSTRQKYHLQNICRKCSLACSCEYRITHQKTNPNIFDGNDSRKIAERFLISQTIFMKRPVCGKHPVRKKQWISWSGKNYEEISSDEMDGRLYTFLRGKKYKRENINGGCTVRPYIASSVKISGILNALNTTFPKINFPIWLDNKDRPNPSDLIIFKNGYLDIREYIRGKIILHNPNPNLLSINVLPFNYNENLESKLFEDFLANIFETDPERIRLFAQWFGYNIIPDMSFNTVMVFTGGPSTGKQTLERIFKFSLGKNICADIDAFHLVTPFGCKHIADKYSICLSHIYAPKIKNITNTLKLIKGINENNPINITCNCAQQLIQTKPNLKFTMTVDHPEAFGDIKALQKWLNVIVFDKSHKDKEDYTLQQRLIKEASQGKMINFALQGLKDLRENKKFVVPESSVSTLKSIKG